MTIRPCPDGRHEFNLNNIDRVFPCLNEGCPIFITAVEIQEAQIKRDVRNYFLDLVTKKERDWWVEWEIKGDAPDKSTPK